MLPFLQGIKLCFSAQSNHQQIHLILSALVSFFAGVIYLEVVLGYRPSSRVWPYTHGVSFPWS